MSVPQDDVKKKMGRPGISTDEKARTVGVSLYPSQIDSIKSIGGNFSLFIRDAIDKALSKEKIL